MPARKKDRRIEVVKIELKPEARTRRTSIWVSERIVERAKKIKEETKFNMSDIFEIAVDHIKLESDN